MWSTEGFWRPERRWDLAPLHSTCQTGTCRRRSLTIWGSGAQPQPPTLLRAFWCEWNPFWNSVNTIFNSACQTGKRQRRSPSRLRGLGRSPGRQRFWDHLGVTGTHFWIPLTPSPTQNGNVRMASFEGLSLAIWGLHSCGNGTHFWIALTPFSNLLAPTASLQPAAS